MKNNPLLDTRFLRDLDLDNQKEVFIKQLDLAIKYGKPVNIHTREATQDTLNILKNYSGLKGIIHCFGGSLETAMEYIKLGYLLGIGGVVTFKNAVKMKDVAKEVPLENLMLEVQH